MVGMSEQMVKRYCRFSEQRKNALAAVHYLDRTPRERQHPQAGQVPHAGLLHSALARSRWS
jgi:hypothetical protein